MGNCMPLNLLESDVSLVFNGHWKVLKNHQLSFVKLREKAAKMSNQNEFTLLSLSSAGSALRVSDEETWNNFKIAKNPDLLLILISPDRSISQFSVVKTDVTATDNKNNVLLKNFKDFTSKAQAFNQHLLEFVRSMSYFYVRSCSLQTSLLMFIILLQPYIQKVSHNLPHVIINEAKISDMPPAIRELYNLWRGIIKDINYVDEQIATTQNNLEFMMERNKQKNITVNRGHRVNSLALKYAENNLRIFKAFEEMKGIVDGIDAFKATMKQSMDMYSDERHKIILRVTKIMKMAFARDQQELSWLFSMSDYCSIPGDYRFC